MIKPEVLTSEQVASALKLLPGWDYNGVSIKKVFNTASYPATIGFVAAAGAYCQRKNHHPDYMLVKYKEIEVSFSTHSVGGVTQNDLDIASDLEKIKL